MCVCVCVCASVGREGRRGRVDIRVRVCMRAYVCMFRTTGASRFRIIRKTPWSGFCTGRLWHLTTDPYGKLIQQNSERGERERERGEKERERERERRERERERELENFILQGL